MSVPIRPTPAGDAPAPQPRRPAPYWAPAVEPAREAPDADTVFVFPYVRNVLGFPLRAVRRHLLLAFAVLVAAVACACVALLVLPRKYVVQTRMLAQRNVVMPALDNPQRVVPAESDAPTRLASEVVLSHDNLVSIIGQANLLKAWPTIVSPVGRARAAVVRLYRGPMTHRDSVESMVGMLQARLWVTTNDPGGGGHDGPITIGVTWPEPRTALRIVQAAQQNFIEDRHTTELALIGESIRILDNHVAIAQQNIDEALAALRRATPARTPASIAQLLPEATAAQVPRPESEEVRSLQTSLAEKRATIADLEGARARQLATLQTQLAQLRGVYGSAHPEVLSTEEGIRALSSPSPQLASLRADERSLVARLAALHAPEAALPTGAAADPMLTRAALERIAVGRPDTLEDPNITYAKSRLKMAVADYENLLGRRESARIEMETARAAFKYRYSTVRPPQVPREPAPHIIMVLVAGLVAGVAFAVFAATAVDVVGGRLLEPWQVERQLRLPLLDAGGKS